jgi:hypothetical protein
MFCVPGSLWLLIESRWQAAAEPAVDRAAVVTPNEEALEDRIR